MRILKDKKGIALENAILFMLVIFSLCFLIASLTLTGHYQTKIDDILLDQKVELDQIGEHYLKYSKIQGEKAKFEDYLAEEREAGKEINVERYTYYIENNALTVKNGEKVALYVKLDTDGSIISWCYSDPNPTE